MNCPSTALDAFTPGFLSGNPDRMSDHFVDRTEGRGGTEMSEGPTEETLNLCDEDILSTSMFEDIVGSSEAICRVTGQVMRVAPSGATVLITGESGTGKELIARPFTGSPTVRAGLSFA